MLQFQQSETTAERRRWIIVLVDSADGVTGLTGQTGTVKISKNGGAAADSTNSIVEVDAGDMPGHYYIELTAAELDTLGHISITKKTAGSLAFHDRAIVSYNDPYISAGGFSGGSSKGASLTKKQLDYIAEQVWKYKLNEDSTAQDLLITASEHPITDLSSVTELISNIDIPVTDLTPIVDKIDNIVIPKPFDYSKEFHSVSQQLSDIVKSNKIDVESFVKVVNNLQTKMDAADKTISTTLNGVDEVKAGLVELGNVLDGVKERAAEMSDMDKRFENMTSVMQKQELTKLVGKLDESIKRLLIAVTESKFDILEEISGGSQ